MVMILNKRNLVVFASLLIFLVLTLGIDLLHTEKTCQESKDCPACHFQNSIYMTAQIDFYHHPELSLIELLKARQPVPYHDLSYTPPSSRSPPSFESA